MSFEEMQAILQGITLSQQQLQLSQKQLQLSQQRFQDEMGELKALANSNSRAIQAMLDQATTDRLVHEERTRQHEERMLRLEAMSAGLINLSALIDEDRPTILRLLNSTNNKIDTILDRLPPQQ
jgi:hypothetical protein